jgi:hypothetical protein
VDNLTLISTFSSSLTNLPFFLGFDIYPSNSSFDKTTSSSFTCTDDEAKTESHSVA